MSASEGQREIFPIVVVGGGQAGLAVSYYLTKARIRHVVLDAESRPGDSWRRRWSTLKLFTPARIDGLPGMRFPAGAQYLPGKQEMADYLAAYADHFHLPVRSRTRATSLREANGWYLLGTSGGEIQADQVIVATGTNQTPRIPPFAAQLDPSIKQLTAADYHDRSQLNAGPVLVVGAGNSGAEIALEAVHEHPTWLSGRDTGIGNPRVFSRPMWWIGTHLLVRSTPPGRRMISRMAHGGAPLLRIKSTDLSAAGIVRVAVTTGVKDGKPHLADGRVLEVSTVVWCTGFYQDFTWIDLPIFDDRNQPIHWRGVVSSRPGVYFMGLPLMYGVSSGLVGGVGRDARHIARIAAKRARQGGAAGARSRNATSRRSAAVDGIMQACVAADPTVFAYYIAASRQSEVFESAERTGRRDRGTAVSGRSGRGVRWVEGGL